MSTVGAVAIIFLLFGFCSAGSLRIRFTKVTCKWYKQTCNSKSFCNVRAQEPQQALTSFVTWLETSIWWETSKPITKSWGTTDKSWMWSALTFVRLLQQKHRRTKSSIEELCYNHQSFEHQQRFPQMPF